ncbi:MAG: hypothetical protein K2W85_00270 [Phycisphaerales bacterium]|nr:hypothetical protein [Phycisphaerales bacterium]
MPVVPSTRIEKVEFYEAHNPTWATNAANIGVTPAQVTNLTSLTKAARDAFNAQKTAQDAAKAATQRFYNTVRDMQSLGGDLIKNIKAYADTTNNPNVYVLANVPEPAAPTPAGPPVAPTDLSAVMNSDGTMRLTWKGSIAQRQFFSIWRQLPSQSMPLQIGAVAAKDFTDVTVPRGLTQVVYSVRAHRDSAVSTPTDNLVVYFGAIPGGGGAFGAMVDGHVIGTIDPQAVAKRKAA